MAPPLRRKQQSADDRHLAPRKRQLPANAQCQRPAHQKHQQRGEQKLNADDFVVGRKYVLAHEADIVVRHVGVRCPVFVRRDLVIGRIERAHFTTPRFLNVAS